VRERLGREGHRDAHHPHPLAGVAEQLPEGVAVLAADGDRPRHRQEARRRHPGAGAGRDPQHHGGGARDRRAQAKELEEQQQEERHGDAGDRPAVEAVVLAEEEGRLPLLGRGEGRAIGLGIALQEVEDAMPAGVQTGREGGPGDRRLRRDGRQQRGEAPLGAQLRQVGQLPLVHPPRGELGVDAVEAEDDELPGRLGRERRGNQGNQEEGEGERADRRFHGASDSSERLQDARRRTAHSSKPPRALT